MIQITYALNLLSHNGEYFLNKQGLTHYNRIFAILNKYMI